MIIGIDGNEANVDRRVGVSEFAFELLREFSKFKIQSSEFKVYLKEKPLGDLPSGTSNWSYKVFGPKKMWTQVALPARLFLEAHKPNVFFTPSHYAPRIAPCPTVISIMDVAYEHFPQTFAKKDLMQLRSWTNYSVKQAKKIITISQASKSDILKVYGVPDDKVVVIYPGTKFESRSMNQEASLEPHVYPFRDLQRTYGLKDHYVLFVSTLQPRKNVERLIEAFSQLQQVKNHELQLIIIGKKGWLYEDILAAPEKFGVADDVKFLHNVGNDDLPTFYQHAQALVFPSLYEGFGLTVLEAMKYGCPVITSNVSSLPEAGGEAALYVDPLDVKDIAAKMEKVLSDKKLRNDMIKKGYEQIKKFSWEKAARETLEVLTEISAK